MKTAISSITLRYLAILVQFGIVIAVAQNLPLRVAGEYFLLFGLVVVSSSISAVGVPDGCVKLLSESIAQNDKFRVRTILLRSVPVAIIINLAISILIGLLVSIFMDLTSYSSIAVAAWWLGYANNFLYSQILVGLGRPTIATFFAYSSVNLIYLISLLPMLFLLPHPSLPMVIALGAIGSLSSMVLSGIVASRTAKIISINDSRSSPTSALKELQLAFLMGAPMMLSRLLQASLPWIPVWVLGFLQSPEAAAIYAAASRLTVAVTSVVASLRFSMRGRIVELNHKESFLEMARLNNKVSLVAAVPPTMGIILLVLYGNIIIPLILGDDYIDVVPVLLFLMFGVLGEAFGGLSDEILKMTGRNKVVLQSLVVAITWQTACGLLLAPFGPVVLALTTSLAFTIQYVWQVVWLTRYSEIKILKLSRHSNGGPMK